MGLAVSASTFRVLAHIVSVRNLTESQLSSATLACVAADEAIRVAVVAVVVKMDALETL
jgi:hypothetical protein